MTWFLGCVFRSQNRLGFGDGAVVSVDHQHRTQGEPKWKHCLQNESVIHFTKSVASRLGGIERSGKQWKGRMFRESGQHVFPVGL